MGRRLLVCCLATGDRLLAGLSELVVLVLEAEEEEQGEDLTDKEEAEDEDRVQSEVLGLQGLQNCDVGRLDEVEGQPVGVR